MLNNENFNYMDLNKDEIDIREKLTLIIGKIKVLVSFNTLNSKCLTFFSSWSDYSCDINYDYEVNLIELDSEKIKDLPIDNSYRAKRLKAGYYITDHFGSPIYMKKEKNKYYFIGENLHNIFWTYIVKYILTIHSFKNNELHLKASSFSINNNGCLLVGRGGGGKTVLLKTICDMGGKFVSNTHNLVKNNCLTGVKSTIRIRNNSIFKEYIDNEQCTNSLRNGSFNVESKIIFKNQEEDNITLKYIFIVNSRKDGQYFIEKMSSEAMFSYMEQFSLALNVYGLKEDIIDECEGNSLIFANIISKNNKMLHELVNSCECYYVNIDIFDDKNKEKFNHFINKEI